MSKRGDERGRDCGMNLTIDGKLSRKEVRERERERKGEKVAKREMRKGVNWKEFSGNRGEREKRQLLIESEFEETQKKGEKKWKEERAKIALEIGRRLCQFNSRRGEREMGDN